MPDAFEALGAPYRSVPYPPTDPDPGFAARLRARLEQALTLPEGVDVTITTLDTATTPDTGPAPETTVAVPRMTVTPYLAVAGAARALDWYADAFGARTRMEPIVMPDGRIGHAELDFGGAVVMLADEFPDIGHTAPRPGAGTAVTLHLEVVDVDEVVDRAVEAGAALDRPPADHPYGRNAVVIDPFGHRWLVASTTPTTPAAPARYPSGTRQGDVGYLSLQVPDLARAQAFYGTVLGWQFAPAERAEARRVVDSMPLTSVWGGRPRGDGVLCWRVDDMSAAVERVRRAGGTATEPEARPYGTVSDCADDQGMAFYLWQPTEADAAATATAADTATAAGAATTADIVDRPLNGTRQGDVAYLTIGVVDSARFRSFFGGVLGWRFTPGRVVDGWNVEDTMPMIGLHGGQERAGLEVMYRVDDIEVALENVRRAGGSPGPVEHNPYGITARCTDDQGTNFYLGQL
jgi:uncharacterized glyoxalase superfamily protein PhnB/extradiol dioxygenase family protein